MVVLCASSFGSSFLFIDIIVTEVPPVTLACAQSIVSFLTLAGFMVATRHHLPGLGPIWWKLGLLGLAKKVIPMILISWGRPTSTPGLRASSWVRCRS